MAWEALSNPNRRKILQKLQKHNKMTPTELLKHIDVAPSTLSEYLKELEYAELVSKKRKGKKMIYSIDQDGLKKFHMSYMKSIGDRFVDVVLTSEGRDTIAYN